VLKHTLNGKLFRSEEEILVFVISYVKHQFRFEDENMYIPS